MENQTPEQITQHYRAMGDSVNCINEVIAGEMMQGASEEDKKACVKRNVDHLEIMLAKDFWTDEDMTAVNAAIAFGKSYV
jgi:hypothetical protein